MSENNQKFIDALKQDKELTRKYTSKSISLFLIYTTVVMSYMLFYHIIHTTCSPRTYKGWLVGLIFVDVIVTCVMITYLLGPTYMLSTGKCASSVLGILLRLICWIESMVPIMFITYYFYYDSSTDTCSASPLKIAIITPIAFLVLIIITMFLKAPAPYSSPKDKMSPLDWKMMRKDQELGGLNPDKMPIVLSPEEIKKMSPLDWNLLGLDLELAGYKVFKHSNQKRGN